MRENQKKLAKKAFLVIAILAIATSLITLFYQGDQDTTEEHANLVLRANAKASVVLMNEYDAPYLRAVSYARNVDVSLWNETSQVQVATNLVTGQGSVIIHYQNNSATYLEGDVTVNISNLGLGLVTATVTWNGQTSVVSFTATTDGAGTAGMGGNLNVVDIQSYALKASERNIMDSDKGYHENVLDSDGNVVGNIDREEITGTVEADAKNERDENTETVKTVEGDRNHSVSVVKPEQPTVPEKAPETTPEVVPTPEPTPEVVVDQKVDNEATNEEAKEEAITLSDAYSQIFVITGEGTITLFGNGSDNLVIEGQFDMVDLGNGFVQTQYGVFAK